MSFRQTSIRQLLLIVDRCLVCVLIWHFVCSFWRVKCFLLHGRIYIRKLPLHILRSHRHLHVLYSYTHAHTQFIIHALLSVHYYWEHNEWVHCLWPCFALGVVEPCISHTLSCGNWQPFMYKYVHITVQFYISVFSISPQWWFDYAS